MALPVSDIRDGVVVVRETTARDGFATFADVVRDTTLRVALPRDAVVRDDAVVAAVPRDTVALGRAEAVVRDAFAVVAGDVTGATAPRDTVARDVTARELVAVLFAVPRDTMFADVLRDDAGRADARTFAPLRGDCTFAAGDTVTGAIGSANTARIDTNVEQTKNAPASKKTVPIAFLICSAKLRFFIETPPGSGNARKIRRSADWLCINHPPFYVIITFLRRAVNKKTRHARGNFYHLSDGAF